MGHDAIFIRSTRSSLTWTCWRSATPACGRQRRYHLSAPLPPKATAAANAPAAICAHPTVCVRRRRRAAAATTCAQVLGRTPSRCIRSSRGPSTAGEYSAQSTTRSQFTVVGRDAAAHVDAICTMWIPIKVCACAFMGMRGRSQFTTFAILTSPLILGNGTALLLLLRLSLARFACTPTRADQRVLAPQTQGTCRRPASTSSPTRRSSR
jgi:hypothetical protein